MATKEAAVKALLTGSSGWTALVAAADTYVDSDLGRLGLTPDIARVDANGKLKNAAVIVFGTSSPAEIPQSTERQFFTVWFYADSSIADLRTIRRKAKDLLHRKQVTTDTEGCPFLFWVDDTQPRPDDSMGGALACSSRYAIKFSRV